MDMENIIIIKAIMVDVLTIVLFIIPCSDKLLSLKDSMKNIPQSKNHVANE